MSTKKELKAQLEELDDDYQSIVRDYNQARFELYEYKKANAALAAPPRKAGYAAALCLDLWPLSDWFRLRFDRFKPGRYFQLCVGPIRLDFYED